MISKNNDHVLMLFFFLVLAIFLTLGRVGTAFHSFALLTPDLGVYASFAAAQDAPELFTRDPFLSNQKNVNSYNMILVPLIKTLKKGFGNYGTACAVLLPFFLFIHLAGYYVLGVAIFKNSWAGLLVSLLLSTPLLTYYDYWGLILDALPRFLYQGLIPFLLALSIWRGYNVKWWPVILGGVGLLNYVHPLSTPAWTIAVMFALWVSAPNVKFWEKARMMGLSLIVLLLVLSPFVFNYVKSTILETSDVLGYDQTMAILQSRFSTLDNANPISGLVVFFAGRRGISFDFIWYLIWMLGIAGIIFGLTRRKDSEEHAHLRQIAAWMTGILAVSGFVPVLERIVFAYLRRIPPEFEILKTLRYLVPLVLLAAFYGLWLAKDELQKKSASPILSQYLFLGASVLLLAAWGITSQVPYQDYRGIVKQNVSCWLQRKLICSLSPITMDFIGALDAVREKTPVGSRIFSEGQEVAVRYYALRPLAFTYKDGAPLAYTDQKQLLIWNEQSETMERLAFISKFPFRRRAFVKGIVELAQKTGSDYLLLQEPYRADLDYPEQLSLVYANANYSLYQLNP
ncbi:MAG TPA: hypothetical protein VK206_26760 [Anaerolineales bacterium]|nr:hypothetical protein [Anaerolineales bacterium]HLO34178.1 hypothetical protein [Anaerolineales bacterium]